MPHVGIQTSTATRDFGEEFREVTGTDVGSKRGLDTNIIGGKIIITDGFNDADIRALTNSNGLNVAIIDALGNQVTSFGGDNTQYTEDVSASGLDPVGTVPLFIRKDTPSSTVGADEDFIAPRGTNYGAQYVTVLTSNGSPVNSFGGTPNSSTATHSNVSGSASSVTLLASNANRLGATIYNDSTAILYLKLGATASTTSFTVKLNQDDYYELPFNYTGIIDGIWASATGAARVVEFS